MISVLSLVRCTFWQRDTSSASAAVLHDFVAEFPLADAQSETLRIELGTHQARGRLIRGWSSDERAGPEATAFVWSSGRASLLEFFLSEPRDLTLELDGFPFLDERRPSITVRINGKRAGVVALEPGPRTYRLPAPAGMLKTGMNRLELQYAFTMIPAQLRGQSSDRRELAVGWNWIGFWPPHSEIGRIDLGTRNAHAFQLAGWSKNAEERSETLAWGAGRASRLRFFVRMLRDLPIAFRCATAPFGGANRASVQVRANDRPVGVLHIDGQLREHRLVLPRGALRSGTNELTLAYSSALTAGIGAASSDSPAIAWETLQFLDVDSAGPTSPSVDAASGSIGIPAGARLDFYLKLESAARITIDALRAYGDPSCRLRLSMEPDPGPARVVAELRETTSGASLPISADAAGLTRLSFASICSGGHAGGVIVRQPKLRGTQARARRPPPQKASPRHTHPPERKRPLVIVYLVDSLRADHLGCYGYPKPVSPHIDAFAKDAWLFAQARSHTSWTRPAVASLFTGLEPRAHGVIHENAALPPDALTLARILKDAGYRTGAVITNGNIARAYGFASGFDFFREQDQKADEVNRAAARWLDAAESGRPSFLYLHTIEPHDPYDPPAAFRRRFAAGVGTAGTDSERYLDGLLANGKPVATSVRDALLKLYDAEIAANDEAFGELIEMLRARRLYDDALIVFCADHGEELGDHGAWRHGHTLYQELVEIPLIVKRPQAAPNSGRRVAGLFQLADVFRMILEEVGLGTAGERQGRSMLDAAEAGSPVEEPGAIFFSLELGVHRTIAVQDGEWKLIRESGSEARTQLFNLREDPAETRDLLDSRPVRAKYLSWLLKARELADVRSLLALEVIPDAALRERLRGLGYVE